MCLDTTRDKREPKKRANVCDLAQPMPILLNCPASPTSLAQPLFVVVVAVAAAKQWNKILKLKSINSRKSRRVKHINISPLFFCCSADNSCTSSLH